MTKSFSLTHDPKRVARQWCLAALFLLQLGITSCGGIEEQNPENEIEAPSIGVSLLVGNISQDFTVRLVVTADGATTASSDTYTYYSESSVFDSATAPFAHTESLSLAYDDYNFEFLVYDGEVTEDTLSTAILLGSASQLYTINDHLENLSGITINVGDGDSQDETLSFFPSTPSFTAYTVYTPATPATQSAGKYSSIGIDSSGVAHISFLFEDTAASTKRLYYSFGNDSSWSTPWIMEEDNNSDGIVNNAGEFSSLAVDSEDGIHISYHDSTDVSGTGSDGLDLRYVYVSPSDTSFTDSELVYNGNSGSGTGVRGRYSSLALHEKIVDGENVVYPYMASWAPVGTGTIVTKIAFSVNDTTDGTWENYGINSASRYGKYASIAVDAGGQAHMAYLHANQSQLTYARCSSYAEASSISCQASTNLASMTDGGDQTTSIDVAPDGTVHILYYQYSTLSLKHVYGTSSTTWTTETVDNTSSSNVGQYADLSISADGTLHAAYYDVTNQILLYKQKPNGGSWSSPITVDATTGVGQYVSMQLDETTGTIHISYYDATNKELKYAVSN